MRKRMMFLKWTVALQVKTRWCSPSADLGKEGGGRIYEELWGGFCSQEEFGRITKIQTLATQCLWKRWSFYFFSCAQNFFSFENFINFFNWRITALQNFVVFCQTSTWISHRYTYVPFLLNFPPTSHPIHPSRWSEHWFELPESYRKFPRAICFTCVSVYVFIPFSPFVSPSPSRIVSTSLFSVSESPLLPYK